MKKPLLSYNDAYRMLLGICSSEQANRKVNNDRFEHSSAVYERFFLDCHDNITILARGIKDQIFNATIVKNSVEKFILQNKSTLNLYLRAKDDNDIEKVKKSEFIIHINQVLADARLSDKNKVKIVFFKGEDDWLHETPSITVGDDRMYRRRYSKIKNEIANTGRAIVNFGDKNAVSKLRNEISEKISELKPLHTINL